MDTNTFFNVFDEIIKLTVADNFLDNNACLSVNKYDGIIFDQEKSKNKLCKNTVEELAREYDTLVISRKERLIETIDEKSLYCTTSQITKYSIFCAPRMLQSATKVEILNRIRD